jgi:DNA-binding transcriptional ArsR family regulator
VSRALDNPIRLEMLRTVMLSSRPVSVSDISAAVDEKESVTSQYLRMLNMQGFIVAVRRGKNVFYERRRDGVREFVRLVDELESIIEVPDWKDRVLAVLPAFSNARKTGILSVLNNYGEISVEVLAERSFMPVKTCYRIVGELAALGFAKLSVNATVLAVPQEERFAKVFLEFAVINSHKL